MINNTGENAKNKGLAASTTNPQDLIQVEFIQGFKFTDNSARNQRIKLTNWLIKHGSITTAQARDYLDVMSPAARIMELRREGVEITLVWDDWTSEHGIKHRIGRYVLKSKMALYFLNERTGRYEKGLQ